jgi:hypothetical protein
MAQHRWLYQRAQRLQETTFDQETGQIIDTKLFSLYLRYATANERAFHKCLADLLKLRSAREKFRIGFESEQRRHDKHESWKNFDLMEISMKQIQLMRAEDAWEREKRQAEQPKSEQKAD